MLATKGEKGDIGPQGPQGATGPRGPAGTSGASVTQRQYSATATSSETWKLTYNISSPSRFAIASWPATSSTATYSSADGLLIWFIDQWATIGAKSGYSNWNGGYDSSASTLVYTWGGRNLTGSTWYIRILYF